MNSSSSSSSRNRGRQQRGGADEVKKKVLSSILGEEAVKNLSKKQLKWIIIGVVAIFTILWYTTPLATVISGMIVNSIVPRYLDVQLGQSGKAYSRYTLSNDFNARNRVSRIGSTIISRLPSHMTEGFEFSFEVIDEPYANAFAYPGGSIQVTSVLLSQLRATDDEIAAVLSHEIGHIVNRHSSKRLLSNSLINIMWAAAMYDDKDDYNETYGEAIGEVLLKYSIYLGTMAYSRSNEYEADDSGWTIMKNTGYNRVGMITFFEKLLLQEDTQSDRYVDVDKSMWWSSTHPHTQERISALKEKARSGG